jgi:hypothetical protein
MMRITRRIAAAAAVCGLALGALAAGIEPASASEADCANGANGFVDIPDNLATGSRARPAINMGSGVTLELRYGTVYGRQRGWARIYGDLLEGDRVWMDWTTNGGASWLQCGPFYAGGLNSKTSAAKSTNPSPTYQFRACARLQYIEVTRCTTPWW